jgi:hypothetical protein
MANKGTGKSAYGRKPSGPKLPAIKPPHGPTGGGRAGNVKTGSGGSKE